MSLLQMSASGAVMIAVIAVIRAITIHRLPKQTFSVLWGLVLVRLLVPISLPSVFSIYSLVERHTPAAEAAGEIPAVQLLPVQGAEMLTTLPAESGQMSGGLMISGWTILWLAGLTVCAFYFAASYLRCRLKFRDSLPVEHALAKEWMGSHRLRRPVSIRRSDRILAPLTYGVLRPVILMPKSMDWEDRRAAEYILAHEYVHIRRFDAVTKLLLTAALCVHWFNPMAWVLFLLANRDIELSCDEAVVRRFGEQNRAPYARMLIRMEERKSGLSPFYNSFSKNAVEERITAIMRHRKASALAVFAAVLLIAGVTVCFATSAVSAEEAAAPRPSAGFTEAEYEKLLALKLEGYEDMSVADYQDAVWALTDTMEYRALLERFAQNEELYAKRDSDEIAAFLFYTLEPLTAERWETRNFSGATMTGGAAPAVLEYVFTLAIEDANALTVGEYSDARQGMERDLQAMMRDKTAPEAELAVKGGGLEALAETWCTDALRVTVEYSFTPGEYGEEAAGETDAEEMMESRHYPNGSREDYDSLLALKTPEYQQLPLAEFNAALLDWANEDYDRTQRIQEDIGRNEIGVALSEEEHAFVTLTMMLSNEENAEWERSLNTGGPEEDPGYSGDRLYRDAGEGGALAWCSLWYQFSYHIVDKETLTVGERDGCVAGFASAAQAFFEGAELEELLSMTEADMAARLQALAAEYSTEQMVLSIGEEDIHYECMDERSIAYIGL